MSPDQAMRIVAVLKDQYPYDPLTPEAVDVYVLFLLDIESREATAAIADWIATERRMPKVADIRERVASKAGTLAPDVDEAWSEVQRAIRRFGRYRADDVTWSHPVVADAVRTMGWSVLCDSTNPGVERAHFTRFYEAARKRATKATTITGLQRVIGALHQVVEHGLPEPEPPAPQLPAPRRQIPGGRKR